MNKYRIEDAKQLLSRTPKVLREILTGLDEGWLGLKKYDSAFNPNDVVGHLIFAEETDWIPRMKIMLESNEPKTFPPFDRVGFNKDLSLVERLDLFEKLRVENIAILEKSVTEKDLSIKGIHPALGEVTLEQHLATWVVHDLTHIFQVTETLASRYKEIVGPWIDYLKILRT